MSLLAEGIERDYRINKRRSPRDFESRLRRHILPEIGKMKAASVTTTTIRVFIDKRLQEEATAGEVNREPALIRWEIPRLCRGGSQGLTVPGVCSDTVGMCMPHGCAPGFVSRMVPHVLPGVGRFVFGSR